MADRKRKESKYQDEDQVALNQLAQRLRQLQEERGLSTAALARMAGVNRSYLASALEGHRNIAYLNLRRIADGLGVTLSELLSFHRIGDSIADE